MILVHDIPQLNVSLCIDSPIQIGNAQITNGMGDACWTLMIPGNSQGRDVWVQSVQHDQVSNVVATWIN